MINLAIKEFCECKGIISTIIDEDEWATWEICKKCGKEIDGSRLEFNHYDGEDHIYDPYDQY